MWFEGRFEVGCGRGEEGEEGSCVGGGRDGKGEGGFGGEEDKEEGNLGENEGGEDKGRDGKVVGEVGRYGEEYVGRDVIKKRIGMKEERKIMRMEGEGNMWVGRDIGGRGMREGEMWEVLGVMGGRVRGGIKGVWKRGVLCIYEIKEIMGVWEK